MAQILREQEKKAGNKSPKSKGKGPKSPRKSLKKGGQKNAQKRSSITTPTNKFGSASVMPVSSKSTEI